MKIQTIKALFIKDMKGLLRQPSSLFMAILFPLILTGAFGIAFGSFGSDGGNSQYTIGYINYDNTNWSGYFVGNLTNNDLLIVTKYTEVTTVQSDLEQGSIDAYIVIPDTFGLSFDSYWANVTNPSSWVKSTVDVYVDQGSLVASAALPPVIQQTLTKTLYGEQALNTPTPVSIGVPALVNSEQLSQFDIMVPGMFVFAAIFITMIVAEGFTTQRLEGILDRIQVTPTNSSEIMVSNVLAFGVTALIQVGIVFSIAMLMGFSPQSGAEGIIFSFILVLIFALTNIGFGLITATIANSPGSSTGISFIFILPQMFLGSFVPVPDTIGQFVPAYYVTDALTSVLLRGASITSNTVIFDFLITLIVSIVVIGIGIILFAKRGKSH